MAASPALLTLAPAVSRHPHLLFSPSHSPCPAPRHLRLAPPAASSSASSPSPGPGGGGGVFLSPSALAQLDELAAFRYEHTFAHGHLTVRALERGPADDAVAEALVRLLASSFSETVRWAPAQRYAQLLTFVIRRYLYERRGLTPHAAVLVGFYRPADGDGAATEEGGGEGGDEGEGEDEGEMACTAEVSFDPMGAPGAPPTPTPPLEFPYICNMTVKTSLRRRGIGKQLLKACEDLVIKMDAKRRVYLHCRIIDQVPFNMYRKAGYNIVQTDSILVWLSLQKRKHLMSKELHQASDGSEITAKDFDNNIMTS